MAWRVVSIVMFGIVVPAGLHAKPWPPVAAPVTITVNSTADTVADDGQCTLREAIIAANTNAASGATAGECVAGSSGLDNIVFNIGSGNPMISPGSVLPTITEPVIINGNTGGATRVVINGAGTLSVNGLTITAGNSTVQSLVINHFNGGSGIFLSGSGGNVVKDCYLGTDAAGTVAAFNSIGVTIDDSPNNVIGGAAVGSRNVISGNSLIGVNFSNFGMASTGTQIRGNYIGLGADGSTALTNNTGIQIPNGITNITIGGTTAAARNVISANQTLGISISAGLPGNISGITIQGNYIGTDATGTLDRGNGLDGILLTGGTTNITIGGATAGAGNVISGNHNYGIRMQSNGASGAPSNTVIQGNFVGTNAAGTAALGNSFDGIRVDTSSMNIIGGASAGARNLISGNGGNGILVIANAGEQSSDNQILGNFIGTDVTGSIDLGNVLAGIYLASVGGNTVGGTLTGAGNLISGNDQYGIRIDSPGQLATGNVIRGNLIGTKADGTTGLGNTLAGIEVGLGSDNSIGGIANGAGNTIAFNDAQGVQVSAGTGNAILQNSIFGNGALGIDLGSTGVTPNDPCDADTGANNLQNFPGLISVARTVGNVNIVGTLNSAASTAFRLEFFGNDTLDPSGFGEGRYFLGFANVTTNANCTATFDVNFPAVVGVGHITATATDPNGNTSEFSAAIGQLLNVSTRLRVQTGENVLIGGFIITGTEQKRVIVRGIGPSLSGTVQGFLADPTLELHDATGTLASNDNWRDTQQAEIEATGIAPSNDLEAAIVRTVPANSSAYTVIVRGKDNTTGIGVVEAYDLDQAANSKLANISTRGFVETGNNVLIGGIIVGNGVTKVVVRAIGPTLANAGVASPLQDPTLELHDGSGATIAMNDNWRATQEAEIIATGIAPTDDRESAIVATLNPGPYTAIVRGTGSTTGVGLVEVYNIP